LSLVLDASITLAWTFVDERTMAADRMLDRVLSTGASVPSLWALEVANALGGAVRRQRCDEAFVDRTLTDLAGLPIALDEETAVRAWTDTRRLSHEEGLTIYDASYLELALRLNSPLASADAALCGAARRRGSRCWRLEKSARP
jgi:predicted nucleic acid-binding protein